MCLFNRHFIALTMYQCQSDFTNINSFHPHDKFVFLEIHFDYSLKLGWKGRSGCRVSSRPLISTCLLHWKTSYLCTGLKMVTKGAWE